MDHMKHTTPSDQQVPIRSEEAKAVQMLEQALVELSRSVCLQRQTLAILAQLNDAVRESPVAGDALEGEVDKLIVERLLQPGEHNQTECGKEREA